MKLLITGATGFIGSQLALEARALGHDVVISGLVTNAAQRDRYVRLQSAGFQLIDGSIRIPAFVRRLVRGCDAVVHLASAQRAAGMSNDYFFDTNVEATRLLLESCVANGVKRFVHGSTVDVYDCAADRAISEQTPAAPNNVDAASKLAAEELVRMHADRLQTTIMRIGETYGPEDFRLLQLLRSIARGFVPLAGSTRNMHQPIHVRDVVRALLHVLDHSAAINETFVLAGAQPLNARDLIDACAAALGNPARRMRIPLIAMIAGARLAGMLRRSKAGAAGGESLDFLRFSRWFCLDKLKSVLQFEPAIDFHSGLAETVSWYRQMGYLVPQAPVPPIRYVRSASDIPLDAMGGSHWQLSDVFESTRDAIIVWEMDGHGILYWNEAAEQLYGFTRYEAQGRVTHALLATRVDGGVADLEEKLSRYGVWVGTLAHRKKDNTEVMVDAQLTLLAQLNGRALVLEVNRPTPVPANALSTVVGNDLQRSEAVMGVGISAPAT
jgi:PAS domain S-box-containing protein